VGPIKYTISADFDNFLDKIFKEKEFNSVIIDLTETTGIDSTNLGLLAKIAKFMFENFDKRTTIISTNEEINEILISLGFDNIFILIDRPESFSGNLEELPYIKESEKEMAKIMLEAHTNLMELNAKNAEVFKDVVEILQKEIKKQG
jgi:anti-anti-sigma regulatory factor